MITDLTLTNFFPFITGEGVAVVDFYAQWCEPCQRMMKILPRLAKELEGKGRIGKLDTDTERNLAKMYDVTKIPTFIFFVNGQEKYRVEGRVMTLVEIKEKVAELSPTG